MGCNRGGQHGGGGGSGGGGGGGASGRRWGLGKRLLRQYGLTWSQFHLRNPRRAPSLLYTSKCIDKYIL